MPDSGSLTFTRTVHAPLEEVFRAFTHPTALRDWLSNAASCEQRKGGHVFLQWNDGYYASGAFTQYNAPHHLAFTWDAYLEPGVMEVTVTLTRQNGDVQVKIVHGGLGEGPQWADTRASVEHAWPESLENLQSLLEDGIDLRHARRPRLGIFMNEFSAEAAKRIAAPVGEGILLEGTAEGSGAQTAGLKKDDLLVSLNGVPLTHINSFDLALKGLKAGDKPLVEFYRAGDKHRVALELGHFPIPELPASPADLANTMRERYRKIDETFANLVRGLSEEQAGKQPAPEEWSVKHLIGHFVLMERDFQSWVADMLHDNVIEDYLQYRPNSTERIDALIARFGSLPHLLGELSLAEGESCALIERLPELFTTHRKHLYRRVAQWELEVVSGHYESEHAEQWTKTIEFART